MRLNVLAVICILPAVSCRATDAGPAEPASSTGFFCIRVERGEASFSQCFRNEFGCRHNRDYYAKRGDETTLCEYSPSAHCFTAEAIDGMGTIHTCFLDPTDCETKRREVIAKKQDMNFDRCRQLYSYQLPAPASPTRAARAP